LNGAEFPFMQKRWTAKPPIDETACSRLSEAINVNPRISTLLLQRGICDFEQAKSFFRPVAGHLHDPFLMKDMDKAVERIEKAMQKGEKILVYGDYDVDGTTAVSLVYLYFSKFYKQMDYYLPDRYKEGYGISFQGITWAAENGFSLIIALDCGIKSVEHVAFASEKNIDFIICDHHLPGTTLPAASAVLDPKRKDCEYPYKELSGCGIGFKLVQAYAQKNDLPFEEVESYVDLAVISIASDIVAVTGENRVLASLGLKKLCASPRPGVKALLGLNPKPEYNISDLVFQVGPKINAAGRIADARLAVSLLTSRDDETAAGHATLINSNNNERRIVDSDITEHALAMLIENENLVPKKSTVLFHNSWHKGVIGIVASRMIEKYHRPTVILTESNGFATGSARSVPGFDLYSAIESCSELLEQFGGHMHAAGLTLKLENIPAFRDKFEQVVSSTISENSLTPEIEYDLEIKLSDITPKFTALLMQFSPFGPGNMSPIFMARNVWNKGEVRIVGANHLKLYVQQQEDQKGFSGIGFGLGEYLPQISRGMAFDICFCIEENRYRDQVSIQLNIKDIRINA
jgi:single-stranded-DNA-specific exonuclease